MRKIEVAMLAGLLLSGLALGPTAATAQEVTLRVHSFLPPVANPMKHYVTPWAEKIEKDSKGRIKVQVYPSMQLGGKAEQLLTQVRDGVVDVAWALPGFTPGVMPKLEVFELPFLHRSTHATVMSLQDYVAKHMQKEFEPYHVLLVHCHAGALFMTKDPINKVEDFQGMKLRSYSRTNAWILEALGATPLQVALPELAPMLSKGTVTGSILPYEIAPAVKMQDLTEYFTTLAPPQPRLSTAIFTFLMNKSKYESLPPDLKKVIDDNSGRNLAPHAIKVWDQIELDGEKVMRSKPKNKFVELSAAETAKFKQKVQPVFDRFKKLLDDSGADGAKNPRRGGGLGGEVFEVDTVLLHRASTPRAFHGGACWRDRPADRSLWTGAVRYRICSGDSRRGVDLRHGGRRDRQRDRALFLPLADSRRLRHRRHPVRLRHLRLSALLPTDARQRDRRFLHGGRPAAGQGMPRRGGNGALSRRGNPAHLAAVLRVAGAAPVVRGAGRLRFLSLVDAAVRSASAWAS